MNWSEQVGKHTIRVRLVVEVDTHSTTEPTVLLSYQIGKWFKKVMPVGIPDLHKTIEEATKQSAERILNDVIGKLGNRAN